jgi:hypothetical protein
MKKTVYIFAILLLTSCALDKQHTTGENFATYKFSGNDPIFYYRGMYEGNKLYQLNPSFQMSTQKEFGVLVDENNKVVKSLSREDMNRLQGTQIQKSNTNISTMNESELLERLQYLNNELKKEAQKPMGQKTAPGGFTERGYKLDREQLEVERQLSTITRNREWETERVKQAQLSEERRVIQDKNDKQRQIANERARQLREQCLGNGQIGICQSSSQNDVQFLCGQNIVTALDNLFNQYCYMTDNFHITSTMEVRNNMNRSIKDIVFRCTQYAKSGTALGSASSTIYDAWNANESKVVTLKFIKHQQVSSLNCKVSSWK